ncbi:hypothetical protein [Kribbella deserti]|uniref:Uncharacterized protein n=1 Tax=Kribbella deserti TaxID=1926257 RepID=A0ABV6QRK7_9ACTN
MTEFPSEQPYHGPDPDAEPQPEDFPADEPGYETEPVREESHPLVEETMTRLDELRELPVSEHGEVYAALHERLQSALAESDGDPS